jgi:Putative MetA-pathway of phenol degradation
MRGRLSLAVLASSTSMAAAAQPAVPTRAQLQSEVTALRDELAAARADLARQEERLKALEARAAATALADVPPPDARAANGATAGVDPAAARQGIERVGSAPADFDRAPEVAVLGDQGSVVTRAGQLTAEFQGEYTKADRNRAVFRGIEVVESVLIGVFDINESRQNVLTAAGALRYGVTDRFEVAARVPFVYRNDTSILAPIAGSTNNDGAATINSSARGRGIGDVELSARYQIASARGGRPFLIANAQAVLPTGKDPFGVPRDENGRALKAATGAGFYGISPSLTAILPTDPAVLFGTVGYTFNLAKNVSTRIPPVQIDRVDPGDAISFSAGIGVALNQRTSFNLGYAHTWGFGTKTWTRNIAANGTLGPTQQTKSRDLQIGRLLFGITYRATDRASINWSVEVGATDDAADVRTVLRIPIVLLTG